MKKLKTQYQSNASIIVTNEDVQSILKIVMEFSLQPS